MDGDVVAVVGPNGCGKSNLVDAILWALGESNVRNLRGQAATDVIFAGSAKRKPLGYAEVILTFDNEDGALPIASSDVTVGRRLARQGESVYSINGRTCRQKDVYELFADSGLGRTGYAVVGQNDIAAVLFASPQERRIWLDEAAGVQRYRTRKAEALKRLDSALTHLGRVGIVISEIETQREPLREEAEAARQFKEKNASLREMESGLLVVDAAKLKGEIAGLETKIDERRSQATGMRKEADEAERRSQDLGKSLSVLEGRLEDLRTGLQDALTTLERAEARRALSEQRLGSLRELEANREHEDRAVTERVRRAQQAVESADRECAGQKNAVQVLLEVIARSQVEADNSAKSLDEAETRLAEARNAERQSIHREARRTQTQELRERLSGELGAAETALPALEGALAGAEQHLQTAKQAMQEARADAGTNAALRAKIGEAQAALSDAVKRLGGARKQKAAAEGAIARLRQELLDLEEGLAPEPDAVQEGPPVEELEAERNELLTLAGAKAADAEQARRALKETEERMAAADARLREGRTELQGAESAVRDRTGLLEGVDSEREVQRRALDDAASDAVRLQKERDEAKASVADTRDRRRELQEESARLAREANEWRETARTLEEAAYEDDIKRARAETRRAGLLARLLEEYATSEEEADARAPLVQLPPDASKVAWRLRRELRALGEVNLGAIEAYERLTERYETLTTEREDILAAKAELDKSVMELDRMTRGAFGETFEKVDKAFQETFRFLFDGGEARLILTHPESMLESGVEIDVQIPGKRTQRLELLSGGERALAACALLFALLKVKPSPLVILDELDAPLDGRNVERYVKLLEDFSRNSQFIVVTHNPVTIEAAPVWFGITMQEPGVSAVLPYRGELEPAQPATQPAAT